MTYIVPSEDRIAALGEYLVAISKGALIDQTTKEPTARPLAMIVKHRMDILSIVGHAFYIDTVHDGPKLFANVINPYIGTLLERAAFDAFHKGPKVVANAMNPSIGTLIELAAYDATRKAGKSEKALKKMSSVKPA